MLTFDDIMSPGLSAHCNHCGVKTYFTGKKRYILSDCEIPQLIPEYQCQDCGTLIFSLPDNQNNGSFLIKRCGCGGQFRRDKPLFCSKCMFNKTAENVSTKAQ